MSYFVKEIFINYRERGSTRGGRLLRTSDRADNLHLLCLKLLADKRIRGNRSLFLRKEPVMKDTMISVILKPIFWSWSDTSI